MFSSEGFQHGLLLWWWRWSLLSFMGTLWLLLLLFNDEIEEMKGMIYVEEEMWREKENG